MFEDISQSLGIELDTEDRDKLAMAIATSGVLEAARLQGTQPADRDALCEQLAGLLRNRPLTSWRLPETTRESGIPRLGFPASVLADAWKEAIGEADSKGARLLIDIDPVITLPKTFRMLRGLSDMLKGQLPDLDGFQPPTTGISSVVIPKPLPGDWQWHWPLRIRILPGEGSEETLARMRSTDMVRRNLASVSLVGGDEDECDLLVACAPMAEIRGRMRSLGLELKAGAVVALTDQPDRARDLASSVDELHRVLGAGAFAVNAAPAKRVGDWAETLIRAMSHNLPFDVALWQADAAVRQGRAEGEPPLRPPTLIADPEFLDASNLEQTVRRLADRIEGMKTAAIPVTQEAASRLMIPEGEQAPGELAEALRSNAPGTIGFGAESDGASGLSELDQTVAAAEPAELRKLYADLTFFDEHKANRIEDQNEPLVEQRSYQLEVALRRTRTGISYRGVPPSTVAPPPAGEPAELLAVISAREGDFDIPQPVQPILLPAQVDADSKINASFLVTPLRRTADAEDLAEIEVRIYYELNLVEHLVLKAEVIGRNETSIYSRLGLSVPIFIEQDQSIGRSYETIVRDLRPRQLSMDIRRAGDLYRFNIAVKDESATANHTVLLHARSEIGAADLTRELNRVRELWREIAMERYAVGVDGSERVFRETLRALARAGRDLWSLLFRGQQDSAIWHIGEWLRKHPPADGALVEIKLLEGTTSFVFPWSLLYDGRVPRSRGEMPDPEGFWGLRYSIEQKPANGLYSCDEAVNTATGPLKLAFMLWESFSNAEDQKRLLTRIAAESRNRLGVSMPPVNDPEQFYDLIAECDADILYFYTHGHTRPPEVDSAYSDLRRVKERYEKLPEDSPARAGLKDLYRFITEPGFKPDESWIALTYGRLYLRDLRAEPVRLDHRPIVILNMCQSAQILPGVSESFVSFFLDRKARSVIGTECPMTNEFAHPFSQQLFEELLRGRPLGEALRKARRYFIEKRNPLGLAYTLFGSAAARYEPGVLPAGTNP